MTGRGGSGRPIPDHPYRDTAVVYAVLALILIGVAALTGSNLGRAGILAGAFFVVATLWNWWRFHSRIKARAAVAGAAAGESPGAGDRRASNGDRGADPRSNGTGGER